jgi:hypothetical protein
MTYPGAYFYAKEYLVEFSFNSNKNRRFLFRLAVIPLLTLLLAGCWIEKLADNSADQSGQNAAATPPSQPAATFASNTSATPEAPAFAPATSATRPVTESHPKTAEGKDEKKTKSSPPKVAHRTGEDPDFALQCGWPVKCPPPLPGSILPRKRIVAYYGNPLSKKMGALGEFPKDVMLARLKGEAARWEKADPAHPVQPALHLIAVVAQGKPGKDGKYRTVMSDEIINRVYGWAREAKAVLFIDIQTGHENIRTILPRFEWLLKNPDVHLGIDPEFNLVKSRKIPGSRIGTIDAADINYVSGYLRELVKKYNLPPKVFIVHRFTANGVTNAGKIALRPEVQVVVNMDGWGAPPLKRRSYNDYVVTEPVQYTGFKLFYHNDTKKGDPLLTPKEVLRLEPKPLYIQYQ